MDFLAASNKPARPRRPGADVACAGLDIGGARIRLAVLRRQRDQLQLERLAESTLSAHACNGGRIGDFELLAQTCRRLLATQGGEADALVIAIPAAGATSLHLTLPAASRAEQRLAQVRAELSAYGLPLQTLALDYRTLGPAPASPSDVQVLALSAPAPLVEDRLALAESLALPLRAIPADGWCVAGFLRAGEGDAVLHLDANACWLSRQPSECLPLQWRTGDQEASLLLELAPLLQSTAGRLLLTGDHPALAKIAADLRKYAGLTAAVAGLPARIRMRAPWPGLAPFHCALALAAEGLA